MLREPSFRNITVSAIKTGLQSYCDSSYFLGGTLSKTTDRYKSHMTHHKHKEDYNSHMTHRKHTYILQQIEILMSNFTVLE